jgi:hypothetical protein
MFALPISLRVLLPLDPVDMRKHFDGLWALAVQRLGTDLQKTRAKAWYGRSS